MKKLYLLFFLIFSFVFSGAFSANKIQNLVDSVDVIRVVSGKQNVISKTEVELTDTVEVIIDDTVRIWADRVYVDKKKQLLKAESASESLVSIETEGVLVTTKEFSMNLVDRTGWAEEIKMHFDGGFVRADKLEKFQNSYWKVQGLVYTPCDKMHPDWSIHAKQAKVYGNYLIRASNMLFKVGRVPIFGLPAIVVPLQNRSQSGFLLPKFSYDHEFGLGFRQEFYWRLFKRFDTTIGFTWKNRRGIVISDELRWARRPDNYTKINAHYAREKNAFVKKNESIIKGAEKHYWVEGDNFETFNYKYFDLRSLIRADFGTDKRVGYFFFNTTKRVSDYFNNSFALRHTNARNVFNVLANAEKIIRNQFTDITGNESMELSDRDDIDSLREVQDKFLVIRVPRIDWTTTYTRFLNVVNYQHDMFIDHLVAREQSKELRFIKGQLISERNQSFPQRYDTLRVLYRANLKSGVRIRDSNLRFWLSPEVQFRSTVKDGNVVAQKHAFEGRLFSAGRVRVAAQAGAEWALPEYCFSSPGSDVTHWIQPVMTWCFTPQFEQEHWHVADKYDRLFARNELAFYLRNNWYFGDVNMDLYLKQAYELNDPVNILPLRRSIRQKHLLPFQILWDLYYKNLIISLDQEYELRNARLASFGLNAEYLFEGGSLLLGCLYQDRTLQKNRELYSDIPLFLYLNIRVPVYKGLKIRYGGQFYARGDSWRAAGSRIRPLIHRVYLEFRGHCWSILFGFEEKRYRQQGNWRNENAFVFSFSLDTLGSFAGKLRKPTLGEGAWS